MAYVRIDGKYFEKHKEEMNKEAESTTEDYKDDFLYMNDTEMGKISEITDDGEIDLELDSALGYFSFAIKLDIDDIIALTEIAIKKLNKFKAAVEAVK